MRNVKQANSELGSLALHFSFLILVSFSKKGPCGKLMLFVLGLESASCMLFSCWLVSLLNFE
mgnify:CR=1 FL=1